MLKPFKIKGYRKCLFRILFFKSEQKSWVLQKFCNSRFLFLYLFFSLYFYPLRSVDKYALPFDIYKYLNYFLLCDILLLNKM